MLPKAFLVVGFGLIFGTFLNLGGLLANAANHSPEKEAAKIRQARIDEMLYRRATQHSSRSGNGFAGGSSGSCKYISGISASPPSMRVVLTFDDGPDAQGMPIILSILSKYDLPATFFFKGSSAKAHPELVGHAANAGRTIISSHSWSHPNFHQLSSSAQANEIKKTDELLASRMSPKFFRYPFGNSTCYSNDLAHSMGYQIVGWHVDSCDWAFNSTGSVGSKDAQICEVSARNRSNFVGHVVDSLKARKGGILLMHEIQPNTIAQLEMIVQTLLAEGFSFSSLDGAEFQSYMQ